MYKLIVFDLDGTLMDSLHDLVVAVNRLVAGYGGRTLDAGEVARMVGEGAALLVQRALAQSGAASSLQEALPRFLAIYDSLLPGETRPYEGIPAVLEAAGRSAALAVLTNKPSEAARKILDVFDLSRHFLEIVGGDGPLRRKPHPDGLLHLVSAAGVAAADTLLVGDSTVDVRTAHGASTAVCVARYGFGRLTFEPQELHGDEHFIDRPLDLLGFIGGGARP